ncbi:MAG: hypothetical protein U0457_16575 [Candidatus Sericytochromatia bacterium]
MKQIKIFFYLFLLLSLTSCTCGYTSYKDTSPFYISKDELIKKIGSTAPKELSNTGKIYLYQNYIFIHENKRGIHVIDNSDIKNPKNIAFLKIPLSSDIAIKNSTLYADMFKDLIAIDINDVKNARYLRKENNVFEDSYNYNNDRIEVGYEINKIHYEPVICGGITSFGVPEPQSISDDSRTVAFATIPSNSNIGTGGSLARFSILDSFLYVLSNRNMSIYNIDNTQAFQKEKVLNVGFNLETIFPYKENLFLGSQTGMYIYDNKIKNDPKFLSQYSHIRSCDPVVVENNTAYVTLRNGSTCRNDTNQLDIIDVTDLKNPKLIRSYPMTNPSGLAIKNNILYLCDGNSGLKIFDVSNPLEIKLIKTIAISKPMDIILNENNHAIVITEEGLLQYDFSDLSKDNTVLSKITTKKEINNSEQEKTTKVGNIYYYDWFKKYILD